MVALGRSPAELREVALAITEVLAHFRLRCQRRKTSVFPVGQGIPWGGFRVEPQRVRATRESTRRARRRFVAFARGAVCEAHVHASITVWRGHARHGMSARMIAQLERLSVPGRVRAGSIHPTIRAAATVTGKSTKDHSSASLHREVVAKRHA